MLIRFQVMTKKVFLLNSDNSISMFMGTQNKLLNLRHYINMFEKTHENAPTKKHNIGNLDLQWKFKPKLYV
jgi:hypothetical protein